MAKIPSIVQHTYIAYSKDERRADFQPLVFDKRDNIESERFKGGHSDIGGGYLEMGLSNQVMFRMMDVASKYGVKFDRNKILEQIRQGLKGGRTLDNKSHQENLIYDGWWKADIPYNLLEPGKRNLPSSAKKCNWTYFYKDEL